jgi:hypothetical protein
MDLYRKIGIAITMIIPTFVIGGLIWQFVDFWFLVIAWIVFMFLVYGWVVTGRVSKFFKKA